MGHEQGKTESNETRLPQSSLAAARGRDDTVHPEIFDDLAVVIEAMSRGKGGQEQTSGRPATTRGNRLDEVRRV